MKKNIMQRGFSGVAMIGIVAAVTVVVIMFGYSTVSDKKIDTKDAGVELQNSAQKVPADAQTTDGNIETTSKVGKDEKLIEESTGGAGTESESTSSQAKAGSYEAYSAEKIAMAATGDVVLFFHASWCPSCRALNSDIEKNVSAIPTGVTILKTDYDNSKDLKQKYGVTTQHTLVQVGKDGNLISKWSGSPTLASLVSQVK